VGPARAFVCLGVTAVAAWTLLTTSSPRALHAQSDDVARAALVERLLALTTDEETAAALDEAPDLVTPALGGRASCGRARPAQRRGSRGGRACFPTSEERGREAGRPGAPGGCPLRDRRSAGRPRGIRRRRGGAWGEPHVVRSARRQGRPGAGPQSHRREPQAARASSTRRWPSIGARSTLPPRRAGRRRWRVSSTASATCRRTAATTLRRSSTTRARSAASPRGSRSRAESCSTSASSTISRETWSSPSTSIVRRWPSIAPPDACSSRRTTRTAWGRCSCARGAGRKGAVPSPRRSRCSSAPAPSASSSTSRTSSPPLSSDRQGLGGGAPRRAGPGRRRGDRQRLWPSRFPGAERGRRSGSRYAPRQRVTWHGAPRPWRTVWNP
jgi:hypothetical protein